MEDQATFLFILNFYDLLCDYLTDAGNSDIKKKKSEFLWTVLEACASATYLLRELRKILLLLFSRNFT